MSGDYDNTNRGAGWTIPDDIARRTRRITANIDGRDFAGIIVRTGLRPDSNGPDYNLWLQACDKRSEAYCVGIWKSTTPGKKLAGGEVTLRTGVTYWVSVFANTNENPKSPKIDLSFRRKEAPENPQAPEAEQYQEDVPLDDDVPF